MNALDHNAVIAAIKPVKDPELDLSILDLGLLRGVEIDEDTGEVSIELTLTSPMCPMGPEIMAAVRRQVMTLPGVKSCAVDLVWNPPWDPRTDASEDARAEMGIWN